jgi:hypothetical protein
VQHSGKIVFPECPIFGTRGSTWHSGNIASPVVILLCSLCMDGVEVQRFS